MHTANEFAGKAIGAGFFAGFGAMWLTLALYALESASTGHFVMLVVGVTSLFAACLYLRKQARHWPVAPEDPVRNRTFRRINIAQWIAIAIVGFAFGRFHLDAYVCSAITAIVGVHLFPLAKLFHRPQHLINGVVLVLWACFTVLVLPVDQMQGVTAFGTGMILWTSAALSLATGIIDARRSPRESGPGASPQAA